MGGAEIQRYLVDQFAISEEEAKKLWNFRQIMHGANRLTRQSIADLPGHTALCWSLAAAALKQAMGHRQEELPTVRQQALGVTSLGENEGT
jgi:hypothetical protein